MLGKLFNFTNHLSIYLSRGVDKSSWIVVEIEGDSVQEAWRPLSTHLMSATDPTTGAGTMVLRACAEFYLENWCGGDREL